MQKLATQEVINTIKQGEFTDIIFDFDETIAHLIIDWSVCSQEMKNFAENLGMIDQYNTLNGHAFCESVIDAFGRKGKEELDQICGRAEKNHLSNIVPNTNLCVFIRENAAKYNFHILSNNLHDTLQNALKVLKMESYFQNVYGRDNVLFSKPHPEGIESIIQASGREKKGFLMIGDNPNSDIEAANRANIQSLLIDMHI